MNKMPFSLQFPCQMYQLSGRGDKRGRLAVGEQRVLHRRRKWDVSFKVPNGMLLLSDFLPYNTNSVLIWKRGNISSRVANWSRMGGQSQHCSWGQGVNQGWGSLRFHLILPCFGPMHACISVVLKTFSMILCACVHARSLQSGFLQPYGS